ncbi:MAG: hypothetical protein KF729_23940 [Sandaracinaceae bacterium]|nr:hypothetical protein [Sandaracinaceae bacterium]
MAFGGEHAQRERPTAASGWLAAAVLGLACGAPPAPIEHVEPPPEDGAPPAASDRRALGPDATYTDLLRAARALDDLRDQDSDAGCLLARDGRGFRLAADLAVAVRPLANAPDGLDARLAARAPVVVLSRWGRYGERADGAFVLNAVTSTLPPREEPAIVWVITTDGVYVRSTAAPSAAAAGTAEAARAALPARVGALFVAAAGEVSLARLASVLALVPPELAGRVALAVPLAEGVRLPEAPVASDEPDPSWCEDGLPPIDEDAPQGSLRPDRIVRSLGPLRDAAASCVGGASGPGAAGGRVALAMRIAPDGRVAEACVRERAAPDPALHACLVRAARAIAFEAPSPPGFVDVELPLVLAPLTAQRQRALCE